MLKWILTIANAIIAFIMLLASGYASDTGDAKTFASLLVITVVSTLNTAYILFTQGVWRSGSATDFDSVVSGSIPLTLVWDVIPIYFSLI